MTTGRSRIILAGVLIVALVFLYKLFDIQISHGEDYAHQAQRQYVINTGTIFDRGSIFFTTKNGNNVSAASIQTGFRVAIVPTAISDPESAYEKLITIIPNLNYNDFIFKASKDDPYEEIAEKVTMQQVDALHALNMNGLRIYSQKWRYYPGNDLAAHTIGFMSYKGNDLAGRYGLERIYEENLVREGENLYVNFFAQIFSNLGTFFTEEERREADVLTSIEPGVQSHLRQSLQSLKNTWNIDHGGAIVMNPKNGEIIAMEVFPSFDLNDFSSVESVAVFNNPLVQSVFEMGSIIKPIIMAIGLDAGEVSATTPFYDAGKVDVGKHTIYNFDKKGRGQVTLQDVLSQSLNTGMVFVSQEIPKSTMRQYLNAFEIGEETGIDLPGEVAGITSNTKSNRDIEWANIAFGQGIALTPINTVRSLAALGNGGVLVHPHVVNRLEYINGFAKDLEFTSSEDEEVSRVISEETSQEITRMLVELVDTQLYKQRGTTLENYSIAAKTGTAQIPDPIEGGYYTDRNLHSFFGYFPAYDPEFLVFYYVYHPKGVRYASETLAPKFFDTSKFLINYYNISPDRL